MTKEKIILLIIVGGILAGDLYTIFEVSPSARPVDGARLLLEGLLCWFLYRGKNWARWLISLLFGISGAAGLASVLAGQFDYYDLSMTIMSLFWLASAGLLMFFKPLVGFFKSDKQEGRRTTEETRRLPSQEEERRTHDVAHVITPAEKELMDKYGITYSNGKYLFKKYKYDDMSAAIGYAKRLNNYLKPGV